MKTYIRTPRIATFLISSVLGLSSLAAQAPDNVATLKDLNRQLLEASSAADGYVGSNESSDLTRLLATRKAALTALIANDPNKALALSFPSDLLARLRAKYPRHRNLLESRGSWQGIAELLIADDETLTTGKSFHFLKTGRATMEVYFAGLEPSGLTSGSILNVEGVQVDNMLAVEQGEVIANSTAKAANGCEPVGGQRVVVILTRFSGYSLPSGVNADLVRGILRGNAYTSSDYTPDWSVDDFWRENSDGQTWIDQVRVVGPYTLSGNYNSDTNNDGLYDCQHDDLMSDAIAAADGAVNFNDYDRVLIVFPKNTRTNNNGSTGGCTWGGLGSVGCWSNDSNDGDFTASISWLRADQVSSRGTGFLLGSHELGHAFGMLHANSRDFGAEALGPLGEEGTISEYGDWFSTLGTWNFGFYSAQHATDQLGWLDEGTNVQVVENNGTYTIQNYEARPAGVKALKIRRGTGNNAWLWAEFRQDTGIYDSQLRAQVHSGALIHYQDSYTGAATHLADFTEGTVSFRDPALSAGQTWSDPYSDLTLSVDSVAANGMTVTVTYSNSGGCLEADPAVTLAPTSQTTLAGQPLSYNVSISNQDGAGCGAASFNLLPTTPHGWTAAATPSSLSLDPGQAGNATLTVEPPQGTSPATYDISVEAAHPNGTNAAAWWASVHVEPIVDDLAVTSVTAAGSAVQGDSVNVYVTVQNTGNVAVVQNVPVALNDLTENTSIGSQSIAGLGVGASQTLTFIWNTAGATAGTSHTLQAGHLRPDAVLANDSASTTVALSQPLSFISLTPSSLSMGTSVAVTITGTGFQSGAALQCWNGSGPQPTASNVVVLNSSTITATVQVGDDNSTQDRAWNIRVTNPGGATAAFAGALTVLGKTPQDGPPQIAITSPSNGTAITLGDSVTVAGSASDTEDGNLSANLIWASSLAGTIGNGGSFNWTPTATGSHLITASATDSNGGSSSQSVTLTVNVDAPPSLSINSPSTGTTLTLGSPLTVSGAANDNEDGNISQSITWSSSREGSLGTGANLSWTPAVTGNHVITALVSDSSGQSTSKTVSIAVNEDQAPIVSISSPSGQQSYPAGVSISLVASAGDGEDGNISHLITWSSSLEGIIGSGGSRSWTPSVTGFHVITASVTDSGNNTGSATTSVSVFQNSAPLVSISSPSGDQALPAGSQVTLTASAVDGEDGDLSHLITWTSNIEGAVGTGGVVSWTPTTGGVHVITASVVDSAGMTGSASTSVAVDQPIVVTFSKYKQKGRHRVNLHWTGAQGAQVEIYRTGTRTANITTANDGQYLDAINKKGQGRYTYQVCEIGGLVCSPAVQVRF